MRPTGFPEEPKSFESAVEKSQQFGIAVSDLDDLAGFRVVCGTQLDADSLLDFFRNGLRGTSFKVLKDKDIDREDGYRAHHLVIEVDEAYTSSWQSCKVEIQVHTALQNAFNRLSRSWLYKSGRDLPPALTSRFTEFAMRLKELDQEARELQSDFVASSEGHRDGDPLTPLAYKLILCDTLGEQTDDDSARWYSLHYRRAGMQTCRELRDFFSRSDIDLLYEKWRARSGENDILRMSSLTKQQFWQLFGTRMEWATKFFESHVGAESETGPA